MCKKIAVIFLIFGLVCFNCFAEGCQKYSACTDVTDGTTIIGKIKTTFIITDINENTQCFCISKTVDPFPQILMIEICVTKGKKKYEFHKVDNWGNNSYGYIKFVGESIEFYLDCDSFSENGKNYSRYYGDTEILTIDKT